MGLAGGCATPCKPLGVSCDFPLYVKSCGKDYELVTVCDKVTGLPLIAVVGIDNETGLPTSLVYNLNGTPFIGTTISCSYPFEIEYQIVCQNGVTQFTRGDIWKDGVPTGLHFYLNALGAVVATPSGTITVGSCPLPAEIDQESIDWQPICVSGVTWYFADNYNFNNVTAIRSLQPTLYKLGDNGVITTTRPTGTFIQGYCPSLSWTEQLCNEINATTNIKFNRVYTLNNGVVTFADYDLNGALYTPTGTIGDCPVVDNSVELDNSAIDWNPICVSGVQYYFADVMLTDNTTGLSTSKTLYKLGDDGVVTNLRPTGTITGGYCCLPEPTSEVCYTVTENHTISPVAMMGGNGISGSKVYGDTIATISIEPSSLVVTNLPTETLVQTGSSGTPVQDRKIKISFSKPVKWQIDFANIQFFNTNINFSERFYNFNIKPDSTVIHPKHQYDVLGNNILGPIDGTCLTSDRSTFRYNSNEGIEFIAGFAGPVGTQVFGNIEFTTTYQRKATVYVDCNGVVTYRDSITGAIVSASLIEACVTKKCCEEIDVDSINWHPMCSCGSQYYWADVITVDNQTGLYTVTTYYKLEDDGEITIVRPACAVVLGYCPQVNQTVRSHNNFILAAGATIPITTGALSLVVTKTNGIGTVTISGTNGTNYPLTFNNESFSQGVNEEVSVLNNYSISSVGGATAKISEVR